MLIPHLHFRGECKDAIAAYEKAFNTKLEYVEYMPDGKIMHASMKIHGQEVYLNDNLDSKKTEYKLDAVHLIVWFKTPEELLACYNIIKTDGDGTKFVERPYSKLCGNFLDKFGVMWGFMAEA